MSLHIPPGALPHLPVRLAGFNTGAGYLLDSLQAEENGLALGFMDDSAVVRDTATPANDYASTASGLLTYTSPSAKNIFNPLGVMESGTTIRCDHDPATLVSSVTSSLLIDGVVGLTYTKAFTGGDVFTNGRYIRASDPSNPTTKYMVAVVTAHSAGSVTFRTIRVVGSGTVADWKLIRALGVLIEPAATNYFLNSATLSTQNITTAAVPTTVSFWGTGTITFSGTYSGSLVGTGANNRVQATFSPTAGTLTCTVSGSVTNAQAERQPISTSYIVTAGSTATRATDNISMATSLFPYNQPEGSIFAQFTPKIISSGVVVFNLFADTNNRITLAPTTSLFQPVVVSASTTVASITAGTMVANQEATLAHGYKANDFISSLDGAAGVSDTSGAVPAAATTLSIGNFGSGQFPINGHLTALACLPYRPTNAQIPTWGQPS